MLLKAMSVLILLAGMTSTTMADTLILEGINADSASAPARGISKNRVSAEFGEPVSKSGAVGDPPISAWEYEPFVVYFEYDHVIHTVARRQ